MGTTTTPNLNLIKPDGNEPGSNFPAQHGSNMDTLDSRVGDDIVANTINLAEMHPIENFDNTSDTATSSSYVPSTNSVGFTFVAPPSGRVLIINYADCEVSISANVFRTLLCSFELREGGIVGSGTLVVTPLDANAVKAGIGSTSGMSIRSSASSHLTVSGLTPGATYNIRTMLRLNSTTTVTATNHIRRLVVVPCL